VDAITKDQVNLRENIKALKGSAEESLRYNATPTGSIRRKTG